MPTVRDTIDPTYEREVSDEEALDLDRMGLLLKSRAKRPETLRAAAVRQVLEQQRDAAPAPDAAPVPDDGGEDEGEDLVVVDQDEDDDQDDDESQDPGDAPVSTTDDTPTRTSQES